MAGKTPTLRENRSPDVPELPSPQELQTAKEALSVATHELGITRFRVVGVGDLADEHTDRPAYEPGLLCPSKDQSISTLFASLCGLYLGHNLYRSVISGCLRGFKTWIHTAE
jgi:hypothetical protein